MDDTWRWDGTAWEVVDNTGLPPRLHAALVYDDEHERLLLFGGFGPEKRESTLLEWRGQSWQSIAGEPPAARAEHEGVYAPELGLLVFGGVIEQGMDYDERVKTNDLHQFGEAGWELLSAPVGSR